MGSTPNQQPDPGRRRIVSGRVFPSPLPDVYAALSKPNRLATWWGPEGFTNSIEEFDLRPGGRWRLVMKGPHGDAFRNESRFVEVVPNERIVFDHLEPIHAFRMTQLLESVGGGTRLTWTMEFEREEECARVREFIESANEQNFDRLARHLGEAAATRSPQLP